MTPRWCSLPRMSGSAKWEACPMMTWWHRNIFSIFGHLWREHTDKSPPSNQAILLTFVVGLYKLLKQQPSCWWFETSWRRCDRDGHSTVRYWGYFVLLLPPLNLLRPGKHGRNFIGDIFQCNFLTENHCVRIILVSICLSIASIRAKQMT